MSVVECYVEGLIDATGACVIVREICIEFSHF